MKTYNVLNSYTGTTETMEESTAKEALISYYIIKNHGMEFVDDQQCRNSVKHRVRDINGFLIASNYLVINGSETTSKSSNSGESCNSDYRGNKGYIKVIKPLSLFAILKLLTLFIFL